MIALIQRVREARVEVEGDPVAGIGQGILALIGIQKTDTTAQVAPMARRLLDYRVFADDAGRMNLSLRDIQGGLLLVPSFTLAANTGKGLRPGFDSAAAPTQARELFESLVSQARSGYPQVASGRFGADMQVYLVNDGPVTFTLTSG